MALTVLLGTIYVLGESVAESGILVLIKVGLSFVIHFSHFSHFRIETRKRATRFHKTGRVFHFVIKKIRFGFYFWKAFLQVKHEQR